MAATTIEVPASNYDGDINQSPAPINELPIIIPGETSVDLAGQLKDECGGVVLPEKEGAHNSQQPVPSPLIITITQHPFSPPFTSHKTPSQRSNSGPTCRICHEGDSFENLISPCECSGSLATIHKSCLEKWLSASNSTHCEICKYRYDTIRCPRPLWHWFRSQGMRDRSHGFFGDLLCLLILAPLCLISVYLCGVGASVYMRYGMWESTGLALLCCFLLLTFLMWCAVTARFHWKMINNWRRTHQVVRLTTIHPRQPRADATQQSEVNNNASMSGSNAVESDVLDIETQHPQVIGI